MKTEELKNAVKETNELIMDLVAEGQEFPEAVTQAFDQITKEYGGENAKEIIGVFTEAVELEKLQEATSAVMLQREKEDVCEMCGGTGETDCGVWDEDSHCYQPTGSQKCECQLIGCDDEE